MDRDTLQRAIEPFFTTKGVGRGTGLGLPMVHGLAAQSGGLFQLTSAMGEGTTACIYLPAVDVEIEPRPPSAPETTVHVEPSRILLVDDEELVRLGTLEMLEALGHEVCAAASGAGALQCLRAGAQVDLLIADYMMPGMTGLDLIREVHATNPGLPALLVTGYAGLQSCPDDGVLRLGKPFGQRELQAAIAGLLGSGGAAVDDRQDQGGAVGPADE
jgi:CheY-like chemotaxis protein